MDIQVYLNKLAELELDMGCDCVICFHPDGSGFVMQNEGDHFVLDFDNPQESLVEIQGYIDMPIGEN